MAMEGFPGGKRGVGEVPPAPYRPRHPGAEDGRGAGGGSSPRPLPPAPPDCAHSPGLECGLCCDCPAGPCPHPFYRSVKLDDLPATPRTVHEFLAQSSSGALLFHRPTWAEAARKYVRDNDPAAFAAMMAADLPAPEEQTRVLAVSAWPQVRPVTPPPAPRNPWLPARVRHGAQVACLLVCLLAVIWALLGSLGVLLTLGIWAFMLTTLHGRQHGQRKNRLRP